MYMSLIFIRKEEDITVRYSSDRESWVSGLEDGLIDNVLGLKRIIISNFMWLYPHMKRIDWIFSPIEEKGTRTFIISIKTLISLTQFQESK